MNDTNFKQSLREKAEKYEMDAPEGLWEGIERKVKGRTFIHRLEVISAAAAAVVLLAGLGFFLTRQTPEVDPVLAEVPVSESVGTQTSDESSAESVTETLQADAGRKHSAGGRRLAQVNGNVECENVQNGDQEQSLTTESGQAEEQNNAVGTEKETENRSIQPERSRIVDDEYYRDAFREEDAVRRHRAGRLSLKLLAANSSGISLNMGRMMDASPVVAALKPENGGIANDAGDEEGNVYSSDRIGDILIANLNSTTSSESHHHQPLTFGVRVAYPLAGRLAVESGLNYSLLRSDFNYGGTKAYEEKRQTLHYLGIPLSLNYTLVRYRRLDFIVSAGGMVEKCVYGKVVTDYVWDSQKNTERNNLSVKGLQWSAGASASLQYNFARNFGIFVEPGLWYRFENSEGSDVRSSYTENPLNFSLAAGLRVNL